MSRTKHRLGETEEKSARPAAAPDEPAVPKCHRWLARAGERGDDGHAWACNGPIVEADAQAGVEAGRKPFGQRGGRKVHDNP